MTTHAFSLLCCRNDPAQVEQQRAAAAQRRDAGGTAASDAAADAPERDQRRPEAPAAPGLLPPETAGAVTAVPAGAAVSVATQDLAAARCALHEARAEGEARLAAARRAWCEEREGLGRQHAAQLREVQTAARGKVRLELAAARSAQQTVMRWGPLPCASTAGKV